MKKIFGLLVMLIVSPVFVYAGSCITPIDGMVITEDTTFCTGTYSIPNGITIDANNTTLNCSNAILDGNGTKEGVSTSNTGVTIKNCILNNFKKGIMSLGSNNIIQNNVISGSTYFAISVGSGGDNVFVLNNEIKDNKGGIDVSGVNSFTINENIITNSRTYGILLYKSNNGEITNNTISDCGWDTNYTYRAGISLAYENYNNIITENVLMNNEPYNLWLRGVFPDRMPSQNKIWNNDIHTTSITDENATENIYCVSCVGNNYYTGASGPTCPVSCDADLDGDGVIDKEDACLNTPQDEEALLYGCSCNQILDLKPGRNKGKLRNGCSKGTIHVFEQMIGWAKDLFE